MNKTTYFLAFFVFSLTLSSADVYAGYGWDDFSSDIGTALSQYIPYIVGGMVWPIIAAYAAKAVWSSSKPVAIGLTIQAVFIAVIAPATLPGFSTYYKSLFSAIFGIFL